MFDRILLFILFTVYKSFFQFHNSLLVRSFKFLGLLSNFVNPLSRFSHIWAVRFYGIVRAVEGTHASEGPWSMTFIILSVNPAHELHLFLSNTNVLYHSVNRVMSSITSVLFVPTTLTAASVCWQVLSVLQGTRNNWKVFRWSW
jgi:hypothetical protein